jgi:trans-resveratrol di-O-methyltransferase
LSVSPFLLAALDPILTMPWNQLSEWFQNKDLTPFVTTHGSRFWDLAGHEPRFNHFFNEGMASDSRLISGLC